MPFSYASVIDAASPHDWSAERLKLVIEAAQIGTFDYDLVTGTLVWSERCKALFGLTAEAEVDYPLFLDLLHPDDREETDEAVQCSLDPSTDGTYSAEYRVVQPDGSVRWIGAQGRGYFEERDGQRIPIRMLGTVLDITARKQSEAAIIESEIKFRAIADSMPQMVWSTRPDGHHDYFNQRWYDFTGAPPGTTDGPGWNDMFHPEDRDRAWESWRHSLVSGEPYEIEYRLRRRDGVYRWVLGRALPVRDKATGEIVRWFGTCTDIEQTKRTERELMEALEAKDALLYEVNHRVKNSLAVVVSLLTLQASRASDPSLKQSLLEARGRVSVVAQVHQRLYTSSRHDSVEVAPFLTEVANDVEGLLDTDGRVHLELEVDTDGLILSIDKAVPLALVVSELLTNAVKYAFPDGMTGTVRMSVESSDHGVCIVVEDDGIGLDAGFDITASTGFGMRIVTALTRQIRARLSVPPVEKGTRFEIFLPEDEAEED